MAIELDFDLSFDKAFDPISPISTPPFTPSHPQTPKLRIPLRNYEESKSQTETSSKVPQKKPANSELVFNLLDLDIQIVNESLNDSFKISEAREKIQWLKSFILEFKDSFSLDNEALEQLETLDCALNKAKNNTVSLRPDQDLLSFDKRNDFCQDGEISLEVLKTIFSDLIRPAQIPENFKNLENSLKNWINKELDLNFEEILVISKYFRLVDLWKLQKLYSMNPGLAETSLKEKFFEKEFPLFPCNMFLGEFLSPWRSVPNELSEICDMIEKYFIVHPSELASLNFVLRDWKIRPFLGLTWPYRVVSLKCVKVDVYLNSRFKLVGKRKGGFKYLVVHEDYYDVAKDIVYTCNF